MGVKVVDASALGALLFGEPEGETVAERLRDATLAAPALLGFEMASVCQKKMRRHPTDRDELLAAFDLLPRMTIDIFDVNHAEVVRLAESLGLTVYDASYLWLSQHLGAELVTLDRQLDAAR